MQNRQKTWLWISAIVSMIVGLILVWNNTSAGWFRVALGIVDIGADTPENLTRKNCLKI